jgi:hypothetical protein
MRRVIAMKINNKRIPLNKYVKKVFMNIIEALIKTLHNIPEDVKSIEITMEYRPDKEEKPIPK